MTNTASAGVHVFVGENGTYPIPPCVLEEAQKLNAGKRLSDLRTKGAKYLQLWGNVKDAQAGPCHYSPDRLARMIAEEVSHG